MLSISDVQVVVQLSQCNTSEWRGCTWDHSSPLHGASLNSNFSQSILPANTLHLQQQHNDNVFLKTNKTHFLLWGMGICRNKAKDINDSIISLPISSATFISSSIFDTIIEL